MIIEGSYASLLSGVSQQVPRERLKGQLSVQENMLSDPVTGLRRRPGLQYRAEILDFLHDATKVKSMYMEVGTEAFNLFMNVENGKYAVTSKDFHVTSTGTCPYLQASTVGAIRIADAGGDGWILNTEKVVGTTGAGLHKRNPKFDGFFYIRTGSFHKVYTVRVAFGGWVQEYSYQSGESAASAVPESIASALVTQMNANSTFTSTFNAVNIGAYVFISRDVKNTQDIETTITSPSGQSYIVTSGAMNLPLVQDLPARCAWDGVVVSIGQSLKAREYYRWNGTKQAWEESSSYASATALTNTPIRFAVSTAGVFSWEAVTFEGRIAGDEENNPYPEFIDTTISGISAYQGRLVLLSGAYVCMSASNHPTRFMRSTVTTIRDDDPIQVGASSATAAKFEYGIQFNKDLVLISKTHQAVVPTGQTGITPLNAMVVLTSEQTVDTEAEPKVTGRTLMFSTPISEGYFGVSELVPSQYTNSQYTPQTLTDHIPRYMNGRCRQIVGSNSTNLVLFTSTTALRDIVVHEYLWQGEERVLASWHKWHLPVNVVSAHYSRDIVVVTLKVGNNLVICTVDTKASAYLNANNTRPYLDAYTTVQVTNNEFVVPVHLRDPVAVHAIRIANTGTLEGEPVGIESINTSTWVGTTVKSFNNGYVHIGWKYSSAMSPTPPLVRDNNDTVISTTKATLMRYVVTVQKTGEFRIEVKDAHRSTYDDTQSALTWSSSELGLGKAQLATIGSVTIPCRTLASTTEVVLSTDGTREFNILDIEYMLRIAMHKERKRI